MYEIVEKFVHKTCHILKTGRKKRYDCFTTLFHELWEFMKQDKKTSACSFYSYTRKNVCITSEYGRKDCFLMIVHSVLSNVF